MSIRTSARRAAALRLALALCAALVALVAAGRGVSAQEATPAAERPFRVYLPTVGGGAQRPSNPSNPGNPADPKPVRGGAYFFTKEIKTNDAAIAVDPRGGLHVAFKTFVAEVEQPAAYYGYCPGSPLANCATDAGWSYVSFGSTVDEVQLALTADSRPRILFRERKEGTLHYNYAYVACEANCTAESTWSGVYVVEAAGVGTFDKDNPQRSFALDPQGNPRFVYVNPWGNGKPQGVFYVQCDVACATPQAQWTQSNIVPEVQYRSPGMDYPSLAFTRDGRPRVVGVSTYSGDAVGLQYFACDAACDDPSSWSITFLGERGGGAYAGWDLALDAQDRPRVVQFQGALTADDLGRLIYLSCDAGCEHEEAWRKVTIGAPGEGTSPDLELDRLGRPRIAYGYRPASGGGLLGYAWCDGANCAGDAGQWRRQTIETNATLNATFTPDIPLSCKEQIWSDAIPSLSLDAAGNPRIAYDALNSAMCYYDLGPGNGVGYRAEKIWRVARVVFFDQP